MNAEPLDPKLRELYRAASATQKLAIVSRLNATLIGLKDAKLREGFPSMFASERHTLVRRWWLGSRN